MDFLNWAPNEPNGNVATVNEKCTFEGFHFYDALTATWFDVACTNVGDYVCKKESIRSDDGT